MSAGSGKLLCRSCGRAFKKSDLKSLDANGQSGICQGCLEQQESEKAAAELARTQATALKEFIAVLKGQRIQAPHDSELAAVMIREMGGLERFAERWRILIDRMEAAMEVPNKTLMDQYREIARLIHYSTQTRDTAPDLASISDDDLETMLSVLGAKLLSQNPELVAGLLAKAGFQVKRHGLPKPSSENEEIDFLADEFDPDQSDQAVDA